MAETDGREATETKRAQSLLSTRELGCLAILAFAWVGLFQFFGNSTFGYVDTASLFAWLASAYDHSEGDQIGYLVPFAILGVLWMRRDELALVTRRPWLPALAVVFLAAAMHVVGFVVQQPRLSVVGFAIGLFAITGAVLGWRWMKATVFPMFLLGFCVPLGQMGDAITFPLRMVVTTLAVGFCKIVLGLGVLQNGSMIYDATGAYQYDVAPACSGIRSLTALGCLITVFAFVRFKTLWRRAVLIGLVIPLAVLGNTVRIISVIVTGEVAGQAAGAAIEQKLGFVTFLVALAGVLAAAKWLEKGDDAATVSPGLPRAVNTSPAISARPLLIGGVVSMAVIVLAAGFLSNWSKIQTIGLPGVRISSEPIYSAASQNGTAGAREIAGTNSIFLPSVLPGIVSTPIDLDPSVWMTLPRDTTYGQRLYRMPDGFQIQTTVVLMGSDRTSIHKPEFCLAGQGFAIVDSRPISIPVSQPVDYALPAMKMTVRAERRNAAGEVQAVEGVYIFWFVADGKIAARHETRMAWMAKELLTTGTLQRWAYVSCFAVCPPGKTDEATERIVKLIQKSVPQYQTTPAEGKPFQVESITRSAATAG